MKHKEQHNKNMNKNGLSSTHSECSLKFDFKDIKKRSTVFSKTETFNGPLESFISVM